VSGSWKHAIIKFGRVKLEKPVFLSGKDEVDIDLKPRHARLQNMTYASKIKVEVTIQVQNIFTLCICQLFVLSAIISPKMCHTFIQAIESMTRKMNKL
jgi:DNA-directed RNA polymerase beta subunit